MTAKLHIPQKFYRAAMICFLPILSFALSRKKEISSTLTLALAPFALGVGDVGGHYQTGFPVGPCSNISAETTWVFSRIRTDHDYDCWDYRISARREYRESDLEVVKLQNKYSLAVVSIEGDYGIIGIAFRSGAFDGTREEQKDIMRAYFLGSEEELVKKIGIYIDRGSRSDSGR